jgi:hypothetical protein
MREDNSRLVDPARVWYNESTVESQRAERR